MKKKILIGIIGLVVIAVGVVCLITLLPKDETYRSIKVFKIEGTVEVSRNSEVLEAYEQMMLKNNDEVSVGENESLILKLDSDKYICLDENTKIKLISSEKDSSKTVIELKEGKIIGEVKEKLKDGETFEVETPNSVMAIRGTTFSVEVDEETDEYEVTYQLVDGTVDVFVFDQTSGTTKVNSVELQSEQAIVVSVSKDAFIESTSLTQLKDQAFSGEIPVTDYDSVDDYINSSDEVVVEKGEYEDSDFDGLLDLTEYNYRILTVSSSFSVKGTTITGEHLYESKEKFEVVITADEVDGKVVKNWLVNGKILILETQDSREVPSTIELEVNEKLLVEVEYEDIETECKHNYEPEIIAPTCYEDGYTLHICTLCKDSYIDSYVDKLSHKYGEVIYTWNDSNSELTASRVCENDQTHIEEETVKVSYEITKEPSCTELGVGKYTSNAFDNPAFSVQTKEIEIGLVKHSIISHEEKPATCTETGYEAYEECSVCDYTTYKEIPALNHDYDEAVYSWNEDLSKVTATRICKNDEKHIETETADTVYSIVKDATCKESGTAKYTSNSFDNSAFSVQVKEVELQKLEHVISKFEKVEATCKQAGHEAYEKCENCDYTTYKEIAILEHDYQEVTVDSTCKQAGSVTKECKDCGHVDSKTELPLADHTFGDWYVETAATCEHTGLEVRECSVCGHKESKEIAQGEHEYEYEITKKPTCAEAGEATTKCKHCETSSTETIDKIAHTFGAWGIITESTCDTHGTRERTCLVCGEKETGEAPLAEHSYGDWQIHKEPTLTEEGIERNYCTVCRAYEEYVLDKLMGYTVTVSGGTVNRKGESLNQSEILVGEDEIVVIKANEYPGYTFFQWYADNGEIIPTSEFELRVNRNTYFYICFEEGLDYGDWEKVQERTCTEDGLYTRTDSVTGLKQFMVSLSRGHDMSYECEVEKEATCTEHGKCYYVCYNCGYKELEDVSPLGHDFNGDYTIVEEAYGAKVGLKEYKCIRCDETKTKEYIKAVYPSGNIQIKYSWNNLAYTSTADREEVHYLLGENKYGFQIKRDTENYIFQFYYEDLGENSPVYVNKSGASSSYNQYGYDWAIITYVDSYNEFIDYIDNEAKGNDNGRNNSSLFMMYQMWEDEFNRVGGIPNGYYCSGITDYLGYSCRVMENEHHAYYVTDDNCVLFYSEKYPGRNIASVESITEIEEIPFDFTNIDSKSRIPIDIEYGSDGKFKDQSYFQLEKLYQTIEIYEDKYIPKRKVCVGYEVKNHNGEWIKIEELVHNYSHWDSPNEEFTYKSIIDNYLDGINPEILEIRAILEDRELPVHVTVTNGHLESTSDSTQYGSDNYFLANEEVLIAPDYDESKYTVDYIKITTNGEVTEVREDYIYYHTLYLPESGTVTAEFILVEYGTNGVTHHVEINIIGEGKVNKPSGDYSDSLPLELIATAAKGYEFVGWYVKGLYNVGGDEVPMMLSLEEGEEVIDYYQYGESFGNSPIKTFELYDPYEDIVITAIFEKLEVSNSYIDITIDSGFLQGYNYNSLMLSAIRLKEESDLSLCGHPDDYGTISGWTISEEFEETVVTELDDFYTSYWFTVNSSITPKYAE
jgi:hypothetical protein